MPLPPGATPKTQKPRAADVAHNGCQPGDVGPIQRELQRHKLVGYVTGGYGECSESVHQLVRRLARAGTDKWARQLPTASQHGARGRLAWLLKRRVAMSGLRGLARTLLDRIEHVGTGATTRAARRAQRRARRSAFYAAEDARHEHGRHQEADHSGDGARFWAYNDG